MSALVENFRQRVGFKKTPMNPGDNGEAFAGFVAFANGNSPEATAIREAFGRGRDINEPFKETAAAYIDYIIENHWGEDAALSPSQGSPSTPGGGIGEPL